MDIIEGITKEKAKEDFDNYLHLKDYTPSTRRLYARVIKKLLDECDMTIDGINKFIVDHARDKSSQYYRPAIIHFIRAMKKYRSPEEQQELEESIVKMKYRPPEKQKPYFERETLEALINTIHDPDLRLIAMLQLATGIRATDAIRFSKDSISHKEDGMYIKFHLKGRKVSEPKHIPLDIAGFVTSITEKVDRPLVFLSGESPTQINLRELSRVYQRYWRACRHASNVLGLDGFSTHAFRSSFATDFYEACGRDIIETQKAMNHSRVETTMRYVILRSEEERTEVMKKIRGE